MKLKDIFTEKMYDDCLMQIKQRKPFAISVDKKPFAFRLDFRKTDNDDFPDGYMLVIVVNYGNVGFSCPMSIQEIKPYDEICKLTDDHWAHAILVEKQRGRR